MFSKPISFILVYLITTINVIFLSLPISLIIFGIFEFDFLSQYKTFSSKTFFLIMFLLFLVSFLMLIYMIFDFIFGLSIRSVLKGCSSYEKFKDYDFLTDIFDQVKNKFSEKNVKLYIKDSNEISAFAVASLGRKVIVLSKGIINHYLVECDNPKTFLYALRSVISHEMSHLINKDFLPTFLIITNQNITNIFYKIFNKFFYLIVRVLDMIPSIGYKVSRAAYNIYYVLNFILISFNKFIVQNIYKFIKCFISRSIEFRCDFQSARAFGGKSMAFALSMLGESSYFTLFSTHPKTKSRIARVENVKIDDDVIRPKFMDSLSNYFAIMFLIIICLFFAKQSGVDIMIRDFIKNYETIYRKLSSLFNLISKIFR